jgi:hypothetical protein
VIGMPRRHLLLSGAGLLAAVLACSSPGAAFTEVTNAAPVTPAVGLPVQWTPTPAPTTIPGWKKFTGSHTELWLPERYVGGETSSMIEKLKMQYQGLDQVAEALDSSEHKIRLWAFDPEPGPPAFLTYALVGADEVKAGTTLEAYLQDTLTNLPPDEKLLEQGNATLGIDPASRTVVETRYPNRKVTELTYYIQRGDVVWIVIFATDSKEYGTRLADFELSAQTLTVLP